MALTLHVLAYNLKRVMNIMGTVPLMEAMRALMGALVSRFSLYIAAYETA